jgi:DNA-binding beta-propeller fold protein YncE
MIFGQKRVRLVQAGTVLAAAALVAGCGNNYRPTVTPINSSGPAAQPTSSVVVISAPSPTTAGVATIIDYSGDSVMGSASFGIGPTAFSLSADGSRGYMINNDRTLTIFPILNSIQNNMISHTTMPPAAQPLNLFTPSNGLWAADLNGNAADVFTGSPETLLNSIPVAPTPVTVVGAGSSSQRYFVISQGNSHGGNVSNGVACNISPSTVGVNGEADGIEVSNSTVSSRIPLGQCPVYAVQSSDTRRTFVLNRGSDTITVINTQNDTLDQCVCPPTGCVNQNNQTYTCHPTLPLSLNAVTATTITPPNGTTGMTATAGPVYAEYNSATNQLIVANYDGSTISVIDASLDEYGNDSPTFGTTFTIPVGHNPASVTVLFDGSHAYTANQADQTVSIVNLSSHTAVMTLPVTGHPRTVVSTQNSTQGKVYVVSPDSNVLTIIRTDLNILVQLTGPAIQGNLVDVRATSQNAVGGNYNTVSRTPGYGQPCNLPGTTPTASLAACKAQP